MNLRKALLPLSLFLLISTFSVAQRGFKKDAIKAFTEERYSDAIELYKKAYAEEKSNAEKSNIIFKIAECYRYSIDNAQAEVWYKKAIQANYSDPIAILYLAEALKAQGRYPEAIVEYNNYKAAAPSDKRGDDGAKSSELAQKWLDEPTRYVVYPEAQLNTKNGDFAPTYADRKYNHLIFSSSREGATGTNLDGRTGQNEYDLFESIRDKNGKWSTPTLVKGEINSEASEGAATVNKKGSLIYFTRCFAPDKKRDNICYIYSAVNKSGAWNEIKLIDFANDTTIIGHPTLSDDESIMVFASNLAGGYGGKDLWYSMFDSKSKMWGTPVNLGSQINTAEDELYPFIHEDGTLYFSSNGHPGMGGMDIYKAVKMGNNWGDVSNMKYPINSPNEDFGIIFEGKAERGFFSSDRAGSIGSEDIYSFVLPPLLFVLQGNVSDLDSKTPLEGALVKLVGTDGSSVEKKTDNLGFYQFAENGDSRYLLPSVTYSITVSVPDYLNGKGKETTVGVTQSTTFIKDFALQPTKKGKVLAEIPMPEVLYDLGSYTLRPESKDSLDYLYTVLTDNPTIVIELAAHTDSRGSDKANKTLAENRAKSCVDYLISKGIPAERMKPVGYGESKLRITDAQIAKLKSNEEKEAAHQKNRRTVFSVIRTDFVPKTN